MAAATQLTIGELADTLVGRRARPADFAWPPDAFALAASLLARSGAYRRLVERDLWPPRDAARRLQVRPPDGDWPAPVRAAAAAWRRATEDDAATLRRVPGVRTLLTTLLQHCRPVAVAELTADKHLAALEAAALLVAVADEACAGIGHGVGFDFLELRAHTELSNQGYRSLASTVRRDVVRVLPKCHTPQVGLTPRSLSRHLALVAASEVDTVWRPSGSSFTGAPTDPINLLLLPWPTVVRPTDFEPRGWDLAMGDGDRFGVFAYTPHHPPDVDLAARVQAAHTAAKHRCRRVHGVVMPELALPDSAAFDEIARALQRDSGVDFLVAGVGGTVAGTAPGATGRSGSNRAVFALRHETPVAQHKHHRWLLDGDQVERYGLGAILTPQRRWWEDFGPQARELNFWSLTPTLTFAALICEDLARLDPAGEAIRAIGPNLVLALLMDGPQLARRWPARYATVLADDPGSSVLTLTSLGMAVASRAPAGADTAANRTVALWKDAFSGTREIALPADHDAIILSLCHREREEHTADGRGDPRRANAVALTHVDTFRTPA